MFSESIVGSTLNTKMDEDLAVVSVNVVLSQIEPGDTSAVLSWGVSGVSVFAHGLAAAGAGALVLGTASATLVGSLIDKMLHIPTHRPNSSGKRAGEQCTDHAPPPHGSVRNTIWKRGTSKAREVAASGNTLRHFLLEVTLEDGSVFTTEKTPNGVNLYPGSTDRKHRHQVWKVNFTDSHQHEKFYLRDLIQLCRDADQFEYYVLRSNCKHFSWDALTAIAGAEDITFETSTDFKVMHSYKEFRDASQLREQRMKLRRRK